MQVSERASEEVQDLTSALVESANRMRGQINQLELTRSQLTEKEERLRNLVNSMQEVLLELDKNGLIAYLNPAWETLTGFSLENSIGKPFSGYLVQPQQQIHFTPERLERMNTYDLELEIRGQSGDSVWMQMNTSLQYNEAGEFAGIVSTPEDITENLRLQKLQREHEQNLYRLAITDPLTGVYNRRHFDELLGNMLQVNLNRGRPLAMIIVDIDGFKFINDTYGHPVGDEVLRSVARLLTGENMQNYAVARLAGDEFGLLAPNLDEGEAQQLTQAIHQGISRLSVKLAVGELQLQSSIGVAGAPTHGKTPMDLVRAADVALFHAKKSGRNRVYILSKDVGETIMEIFSQGFELRNALSNGMIAPFMQSIVELKTGQVIAYEVLTRLKRGEDYVGADQFVHIAEDLGLIREMDLFIIHEALQVIPKSTPLFLNISLSSFHAPEFAQQFKWLMQSPIARNRSLTIEFTERATISITDDFLRLFDDLRHEGCKIALDDFGVGYSTYSYLRRLKPDFVKIDGSFVLQVKDNPQDAEIVAHIRELSETFGAKTIAEHVEDEITLQKLKELGVTYGQGYYFGKPEHIRTQIWLNAATG